MKQSIKYSVGMRPNPMNAEEEPKAYGTIQLNATLSLEDMAEHIHDHNTVFSKGVILGVLTDMTICLKEALSEGNAVSFGDLGTFRPTITNTKHAATGVKARNTVEDCLAVGLDEIIEGVNITFIPENTKGEKLTSKAFKEMCTFEAAYVIASKKKTIDGKEVTYQEKIPISSYAAATHQDPEP